MARRDAPRSFWHRAADACPLGRVQRQLRTQLIAADTEGLSPRLVRAWIREAVDSLAAGRVTAFASGDAPLPAELAASAAAIAPASKVDPKLFVLNMERASRVAPGVWHIARQEGTRAVCGWRWVGAPWSRCTEQVDIDCRRCERCFGPE